MLSSKMFPINFESLWGQLLDASIYFSFDKSGFLRHQMHFSTELRYKEASKCLITGGTSGIGLGIAKSLAKKGVDVWVTGRDQNKGNAAVKNNERLKFVRLDMAAWDDIKACVDKLPELDFIVLNAGGMPESFQTNSYAVESQFASQLFGHYYLLKELQRQGKLSKAGRIVWMSSGGMYLSKLKVQQIYEKKNYNKVSIYASVKRAQVTLLPYFAGAFSEQVVSAMHPGWVATPGLKSSIPYFDKLMQGKLRTVQQGADTALWLLSENGPTKTGDFYFDRRPAPIHYFGFTKKAEDLQSKLVHELEKFEF